MPVVAEAPVFPTELASSNGFTVEYRPHVKDQEIKDDIVSYLGEYRFKLQKYDYELSLVKQGDQFHLTDTHREESMVQKGYRAIAEKRMRGEDVHREEAELRGLISLEHQLSSAEVGDSILWFSPPGPKEEGYGDYGFVFRGEVEANDESRKDLKMTAIRVENPTLDSYNTAYSLLAGKSLDARHADEFLRSPIVVSGGVTEAHIEATLKNIFGFNEDAEQKEMFRRVINRVMYLIEDYIKNGKNMPDRRRRFHSIENVFARILREEQRGEVSLYENNLTPDAIAIAFGHDPEETGGGSCPKKSNNPLSKLGIESITNSLEESEECGSCGESSSDNHYHCPGCNSTYSDETNKSPEDRTKECSASSEGGVCGYKFGC